MARIKYTKADVNKAFLDALLENQQSDGQKTGVAGAVERIRQMIGKKKAV